MKRATLASRLIEARTSKERQKLLAENSRVADVRLARELKERCYRVWTSDPAGAQRTADALKALARFAPGDEIESIARWVAGIADITKGKLEAAIKALELASNLLHRIGREHESAQPRVAMLIALAMLGRYDDARRTGEKALRIFQKYDDQLAAGKIEMNLSNLVSRRDQYRLAERYCLSAYRRFRKLGERSWQAMAENGLANTYAELNDFDRAEKFYARALETARADAMHVTIAEIEASMGNLALFRGRYADAVRWLELSREKYEKLGMPHQTAIAELEIADIYTELNLSPEAIGLYRQLIPNLKRLKLRREEARARASLGRALNAAGDVRRSSVELRRAAELFRVEKNFVASAAVELQRASLELTRRNFNRALEIVDGVGDAVDRSDNPRLRLSALWFRGEVLAKLCHTNEARSLLERSLRESLKFEQPAVAQAALNSLGVVAQDRGDVRKAEKFYRESIRLAETTRAPLAGEDFRMAFLAKTLAPYENLSRLYLAEGNVERAFEYVELARSRSLLESIGGELTSGTNAAASKLREELNWLYSRVARADSGDGPMLQKEIRSREKKLAALTLRMQSAAKVRTKASGSEIDVTGLQKRLGSRTALVEFVKIDNTYSAFVVTSDSIEYRRELASESEILTLLDGLRFQFGALRFGADAVGAFATQLKERTDVYLRGLYKQLLGPLNDKIADRDLVIVPAGVLNYVPFQALFDGEHYVIEKRQITYSPSAAVWRKLSSRRHRMPRNALLMAHADERIPLANNEVAQLARMLPEPVKFSGRLATFAAFVQNAPNFDLIHLACHGQFRPDNPMFSSLHLADGWVTVRDVVARRLNAELVTLSACETGLNQIYAGEEIIGLARGFLSAGARSLVLSLWTVSDAATARLMKDFYENLQRGKTVAASLRVAQVNLIKQGEHPYFWSPFFAIG